MYKRRLHRLEARGESVEKLELLSLNSSLKTAFQLKLVMFQGAPSFNGLVLLSGFFLLSFKWVEMPLL